MAGFIEHQITMKLLDTADCLIREALRQDFIQNNGTNNSMKTNLLYAQFHITEALDSLYEVSDVGDRVGA